MMVCTQNGEYEIEDYSAETTPQELNNINQTLGLISAYLYSIDISLKKIAEK